MLELRLKEYQRITTYYKAIPESHSIIAYWDSKRKGVTIIKDEDEIERVLRETNYTIFAFSTYKEFEKWSDRT